MKGKLFYGLKVVFAAYLFIDFIITLSGRFSDAHLPAWFRGICDLAIFLGVVRAERNQGVTIKVHPGIQLLLAAIVILAAVPDFAYRGPFAFAAALIYKEGFAWALSFIKSVLRRK